MFISKQRHRQSVLTQYGKQKDESFFFDRIARYFRNVRGEDVLQRISERTYHDLDLDEVFMVIDRTTSKVGQQYFYNLFRTIPSGAERATTLEQLISRFKTDRDLRDTVVVELSRLNKTEAYFIASIFQDSYIEKPSWFWVVRILSISSIGIIMGAFFLPVVALALIPLLIANYIIHYWNKQHVLVYGNSIPELMQLMKVARQIAEVIRKEDKGLAESITRINAICNQMSFLRIENNLNSDLRIVAETLTELIKVLFLIEPLLLFNVLKKLERQRDSIHQVFRFVGEVDAALSIMAFREGLSYWCSPTVVEKKEMQAVDLYHPLIRKAVANSFSLNGQSCLLTGSNMSGKTTFIRNVGINAILALTINTAMARECVMPRVKIHSAIRITDNLLDDKSYYFQEVLTIRDMVREADGSWSNLFLLDEIFKGTNTVERISAGKAVLSKLNGSNNIVFVSTHDIELTDLLAVEYSLFHFCEDVRDKTIAFDYILKRGKLTTRNAIKILELNEYPPEVIEEARRIAAAIDRRYNA